MTGQHPGSSDASGGPHLEIRPSRLFTSWLSETGGSLVFTTYQASKLFFVGLNLATGRLSIFERSFPRCMGFGVAPGGRRFWLSALYQLWRFEDFVSDGSEHEGYDAVYVPIEGRTTGDVDIHDLHAFADDRPPIFVVTRFNCIATLSANHSFAPIWKPSWIDRIAAEDRCHLNGMAMDGDIPVYATVIGRSNVVGGWREHRVDGGHLIDIASSETLATGLAMPHSPRLHQGELFVIQSGLGLFGRIDRKTGEFNEICFLPGFARGVVFVGNYAVIGVSRPRHDSTFVGLPLEERLKDVGSTARCMIAIVNLKTGDIEHSIEIEGIVQELYDVAYLPKIRRPMALGFKTDEVRFFINPDKYRLRS